MVESEPGRGSKSCNISTSGGGGGGGTCSSSRAPRFALRPAAPGAAAPRSLWMSRQPPTEWPPSRTGSYGLLATMAITLVTPARKVRRREAVLKELRVGDRSSGTQGHRDTGVRYWGTRDGTPAALSSVSQTLSWPPGPRGAKSVRCSLSSVLNLEAAIGAERENPGVWGQSQSWRWRSEEDRASAPDCRRSAYWWLIYAWRRLTWLFY